MRILLLFVLASVAGCASVVAPRVQTEASALREGEYTLDKTHAALTFKIDHLGFSSYVGRFEDFDATLTFDADDPTTSQLDAVIEVASLDIANDDFAETLIGPDWFDASAFPQARFVSRTVTVTGETEGTVEGDLTLKGIARPVTLDVRFNGGARDLLRGNQYVVGFSAKGTFDRTAFGVDKFAGPVGTDVTIEIEAEFLRD